MKNEDDGIRIDSSRPPEPEIHPLIEEAEPARLPGAITVWACTGLGLLALVIGSGMLLATLTRHIPDRATALAVGSSGCLAVATGLGLLVGSSVIGLLRLILQELRSRR
jgi:hypothetical protein